MTSSAFVGNHTTSQDSFCIKRLYGLHLKILISTLNIPLSITAILGNVLIIVALRNASTSLRPPSKLLFRSLASTDLGVGLISQPLVVIFLLSPEYSQSCVYLTILGKVTSVMFGGVSLLTLTAISVERLLALLSGLRYRQVVTMRRIRIAVAMFWLFSAVIAVLFVYRLLITAVIASILLLSCTITSAYCYTKIYRTLRRHQRQVHVQGQVVPQDHWNTGGLRSVNIARYRKTVSSALWVQMTFVACYLPFGIVQVIISVTGLRSPSLDVARDITGSIVFLNSTLNPFLYCWKISEIRQRVKETIRHFF